MPNIDRTAVRIRGIALFRHRQRDQQEIQGRKGAPGGFRTWLTEGKTTDLPAYLTSEVKFVAVMHGISKLAYIQQDHKYYQHAFSLEKGGYGRSTDIGLVCVTSMKKMKRLCITSLYTLCLPFSSIQSLRLKLVLYHLRFPYPTNMQYRSPNARPHLNTSNLANRLHWLRHHCLGQFSGADAATRP